MVKAVVTLRTLVRDCLFVNWALPAATLPAPPAPLRWQRYSWQGEDYVFASVLLFHQEGLHLPNLPRLRFSYPQCNVRLNVLDEEGVPSVLFRKMLMPVWVAPGARLWTRQPVASASLHFPRPSRNGGPGPWLWRVRRGDTLEVRAWPGSPETGHGPRLGTWEETVRYFQDRRRGYAVEAGKLGKIEASHPPVPVWPMRAELAPTGLLGRILALPGGAPLPPLHSCWLAPEIPFVFELVSVPKMAVAPGMPQAAASRTAAARAGRAHPAPEEAVPGREPVAAGG